MKTVYSFLLLASVVFAGSSSAWAAEKADLLSLIAKDAVVAVGEKATAAERAAAEMIAKALRQAGGPEDNLRKAEDVDAVDAVAEIGGKHVIVVGTVASNPALRHYPGTWFLDREAYYGGVYGGGYDATTGLPREVVKPWQETKGFYVGGFGNFRVEGREVGYIECDRSEYFMRARSEAGDATKETDKLPLRLMIRVTGSNDAGVAAAARAFVENGLLGGVVPVEPLKDVKRTILTTSGEDLATSLPTEAPTGRLVGKDGKALTCLGWVQADALDYDGFASQTGASAVRMWRVKYAPETGVTNFITAPHRRNGFYELLIVDLPKGTDRAAVLKALNATGKYELGGQTFATTPATKFKDPVLSKIAVASGTRVVWKGDRLYLESLPPVYEDILMAALVPVVTGK